MDRIYLDYASTTPLDPRVEAAMKPYLRQHFGNPSSLHREGQLAMAGVDKSRETIANLIGANFNEVVFTSSATEANNLALRGAVAAAMRNLKFKISNLKLRIIVSSIEHDSILETARDLEKNGVEVIYLPVNGQGLVDLKQLERSLNESTVLVSIMYANNETGVIQNIPEISRIIRDFRNNLKFKISNLKLHETAYPLFHVDAVQAFQYLDCNVNALGVDLMTLSSHKIYGPKGAGALYVRTPDNKHLTLNQKSQGSSVSGHALSPQVTGGGQEFDLRSGTENVPAIVGFARAAEIAAEMRIKEGKRVQKLRDQLWQGLKKLKIARLNGDLRKSLPNILNVHFRGKSSEELLIKFDLSGVAVSAGSACASRSLEISHVLLAMGLGGERTKESIRFTLGRGTTKADINQALKIAKAVVS